MTIGTGICFVESTRRSKIVVPLSKDVDYLMTLSGQVTVNVKEPAILETWAE